MLKARFVEIPELAFSRFKQKRPWWLAWYFGPIALRQAVTLKGELVFFSKVLGRDVKIKAEYKSDGASVPQVFWNLFPPFGEYLEAAIVHDYFCDLGAEGKSPISFFTAARVFLEAMQVQKVRIPKRASMFLAVVLFGPKFRALGLQPVEVKVPKPPVPPPA